VAANIQVFIRVSANCYSGGAEEISVSFSSDAALIIPAD